MNRERYLMGMSMDLFRPHVIVPAQPFNPRKKLTAEHRLMMAVLDGAVRCIEKYRFPVDAQGRRLFQEAERWLLIAEPHWPYSFERICAALDLDANAVRRHLRLASGAMSARSFRARGGRFDPLTMLFGILVASIPRNQIERRCAPSQTATAQKRLAVCKSEILASDL
jgi:hypothetical protein